MTKFTIEIMQTLLNKGDLDELFQGSFRASD